MSQKKIVVHPLVLLTVTDHYIRSNDERVAGIILGSVMDDTVHITNSYAIPFVENDIWYLNTSYLISMYDLLRKVNSTEKLLGWYHTGGEIHKNDYEISQSIEQFVDSPFLLIISVIPCTKNLPVELFQFVNKELVYKNVCIEAEQAEEVGVEHLLSGIKLYKSRNEIKNALVSYKEALIRIEEYLENVLSGKMKKNFKILNILQESLNERPILHCNEDERLLECYSVELTKAVVALNDLEANRKENKIQL